MRDTIIRALNETPDLVRHLANLVIPGNPVPDTPTRPQPGTRLPGRFAVIDQLDSMILELAGWEEALRDELGHHAPGALDVLRYNAQGYGVGYKRPVTDNSARLYTDVSAVCGRLRFYLEHAPRDFETTPTWAGFVDGMREHVIAPLNSWTSKTGTLDYVPRRCPEPGCDGSVHAFPDNYGDLHAACTTCGWALTPPQWVPVSRAADILGRSRVQVYQWIKDGGVEVRMLGGRRHVELTDCREWMEFCAARRTANLPGQEAAA